MTALDLGTANAADLPRLGPWGRIRETVRLARITLATGEHVVARAYSDGMRLGFDGADYAIRIARENTADGVR